MTIHPDSTKNARARAYAYVVKLGSENLESLGTWYLPSPSVQSRQKGLTPLTHNEKKNRPSTSNRRPEPTSSGSKRTSIGSTGQPESRKSTAGIGASRWKETARAGPLRSSRTRRRPSARSRMLKSAYGRVRRLAALPLCAEIAPPRHAREGPPN